ncbi:NACHT domain-containing protein [Thermoanaerobacterium sp. RBIITD]|nr:NACHT domain-containing protein [Thermoanaerobacterium sp. RBIITD]
MFQELIISLIISLISNYISQNVNEVLLDGDINSEIKECIQNVTDKISTKYPKFKIIDGFTLWDNIAEKINYEIEKNFDDISYINIVSTINSVLIKQLNDLDPDKIKNISEDYLKLLKKEIINKDKLYKFLMLSYFTNIDGYIRSRLETIIHVLENNTTKDKFMDVKEIKEIKDNLLAYLIFLQKWAFNELGEMEFERTFKITGNKRRLKIDDLLKLNSNLVIIGPPGCGKTYTLINLIFRLTQSNSGKMQIPIYVDLSSYGMFYDSIFQRLLDIVNKKLVKCQKDDLELLLKKGSFILFLDGFDEIKDDFYEKCVRDINNLMIDYPLNLFIIASRDNNYYEEFGYKVIKCKIDPLDGIQIKEIVDKYYKYSFYTLSDDMVELFRNPLILKIGIEVIKNNDGKIPSNRSLIYGEFIDYLIKKWNRQKGLKKDFIPYINIMETISKIAYEYFETPYIYIREMQSLLKNCFPTMNTDKVYDFILNLGIFEVRDNRVTFMHRTFKEYFAAIYILKQIESKNISILDTIVNKKQWYEVFIFISGLHTKIEIKDLYLNYVLQKNIKLYVDCVKSEYNYSDELKQYELNDLTVYYLNSLVFTYESIINKYFTKIKRLFSPYRGFNKIDDEMEICIEGYISEDMCSLKYLFKIKNEDEPKVKIKKLALLEKMSVSFINLNYFSIDSSRGLAIERIKSELKYIIEKQLLRESDYIISERISEALKKLKLNMDLNEAYEWVKDVIAGQLENSINLVSIQYDGVELFELYNLIEHIIKNNIDYQLCLLPSMDLLTKKRGFVWDCYSKERLIERTYKFFEFYQESFIFMIESNFLEIKNYMPDYINYPYKYIIEICFPESKNNNHEPLLRYFYIQVEDKSNLKPKILISDEKEFYRDNKELEIYNTYCKYGQGLIISYTYIDLVLISKKVSSNLIICDFTYDRIKENIEYIFGKL